MLERRRRAAAEPRRAAARDAHDHVPPAAARRRAVSASRSRTSRPAGSTAACTATLADRRPPRVVPRVEPRMPMTPPVVPRVRHAHHGGLTSAVLLRRLPRCCSTRRRPPRWPTTSRPRSRGSRRRPRCSPTTPTTAERYLWTEELELRRVEIDIHPGPPRSARLRDRRRRRCRSGSAYAAAKLDGTPLLPRDRAALRLVVRRRGPRRRARHDPLARVRRARRRRAASLYDLRRELDEQILEWSPIEAAAAHDEARPATSAHRRRRSRPSARTGSRSRAPAGCRATVGVDPIFDQLAPGARRQAAAEPAARRAARRRQDRARAPDRARAARARPRQGRPAPPAVGDERRSHRRRHGLPRHVAAALPRDRQGARGRRRRALRRSPRRPDGADVRRRVDRRSARAAR